MHCSNKILTVGSRSSPLAKTYMDEILDALRPFHPEVEFEVHYCTSPGDRDLSLSLRTLGKTDFFTRDIDKMILEGRCRLGFHSAKDLPDPLTAGLSVICLTKGIDSSDSLVLKDGVKLADFTTPPTIATSSYRREEMVRLIRPDAIFCDLRGTIEQRLAKLATGEADGVVIAEAALIRLKLTHLNRIKLPGETVEGQGQLAVVARSDDTEAAALFACIDSRRGASCGRG